MADFAYKPSGQPARRSTGFSGRAKHMAEAAADFQHFGVLFERDALLQDLRPRVTARVHCSYPIQNTAF